MTAQLDLDEHLDHAAQHNQPRQGKSVLRRKPRNQHQLARADDASRQDQARPDIAKRGKKARRGIDTGGLRHARGANPSVQRLVNRAPPVEASRIGHEDHATGFVANEPLRAPYMAQARC